jgi:hypothetical protein
MSYYLDSRYSTFFNLDSLNILNYDGSNCPIYSRNATDFTLFSSFSIKSDGTATVGIENSLFSCFKVTDMTAANTQLGVLTNTDLSATPSQTITIANLQVFSLYLDESM